MTNDLISQAEALIEKHATSGYIHRDATLLLPGLVEEIKRLRVLECAAKANMTRRDEDIGDLMKELGLQVTQDDTGEELTIAYMLGSKDANDRLKVLQDYVGRLEPKYIDSNAARRYYADGYEAPWPQVGNEFKERYIKDAQAALEKIRRG